MLSKGMLEKINQQTENAGRNSNQEGRVSADGGSGHRGQGAREYEVRAGGELLTGSGLLLASSSRTHQGTKRWGRRVSTKG